MPPFITSKLQQAARFPVKRTMMVAQQLYEGIQLPDDEAPVGLITYMRIDSVRVSDQALDVVRDHVREQYGTYYMTGQPKRHQGKKDKHTQRAPRRSIAEGLREARSSSRVGYDSRSSREAVARTSSCLALFVLGLTLRYDGVDLSL